MSGVGESESEPWCVTTNRLDNFEEKPSVRRAPVLGVGGKQGDGGSIPLETMSRWMIRAIAEGGGWILSRVNWLTNHLKFTINTKTIHFYVLPTFLPKFSSLTRAKMRASHRNYHQSIHRHVQLWSTQIHSSPALQRMQGTRQLWWPLSYYFCLRQMRCMAKMRKRLKRHIGWRVETSLQSRWKWSSVDKQAGIKKVECII